MNQTLKTFLTVVLAISVLTAFGGGAAAQPSADAPDVSPDGFDADPADGLDRGDDIQSAADNGTNDTLTCSPYGGYGYICWA